MYDRLLQRAKCYELHTLLYIRDGRRNGKSKRFFFWLSQFGVEKQSPNFVIPLLRIETKKMQNEEKVKMRTESSNQNKERVFKL